MQLREFFTNGSVSLDLHGETRDEILRELVSLLDINGAEAEMLVRSLQRRESLGSTGVGRGIAIPHCRSAAVGRVRLAYGYRAPGAEFQAIDGNPVHHFFLIVAPPEEGASLYLPVLALIARFAKEPDVPERLAALKTPEEFFALLDEKGV
jgi:PTS system nitrogen regulatory IIA component